MRNHPQAECLEGDCLALLPTLEADSVDLIMTSPPYGDRRKEQYGGIHPDKYVDWWMPIAAELQRVLAPTGSFILNIKEQCVDGERHRYVYELVLAMRDRGWRLVDEQIWFKPNPVPCLWQGRFKDAFERLYHFTKASGHKYDHYNVAEPVKTWRDGRTIRQTTPGGFEVDRQHMNTLDEALPSNVRTVAIYRTDSNHPATFPPAIPNFYIRWLTDPADLVLDPFAGSGTTLLEARRLGRRAIGVEIKPEYADLIRKRLAQPFTPPLLP